MSDQRDRATPKARSKYAEYCRPKLSKLLEALGLDAIYTRASGHYLYRAGANGVEEEVLDLVGGFGTGLLGHNDPELKELLKSRLDEDTPFMAQSATREEAGRLGERLNELLPGNRRYLCHFTNSGTEAVEAALKHAYKVRFDRVRRHFDRITRSIEQFYQTADTDYPEIEIPGGDRDLGRFRDDLDEHNLAQFERFQNNPVVLALKGSFHGKTTSSLKVTFNKTYREGFEGLSAIRPEFVDPGDLEHVEEIVARHQIEFLVPRVEDGRIVLDTETDSTVIVLCLEIIQGEGGMRPLADEVLRSLAEQRCNLTVPVLIDEIQTGCGRTGSFVAYMKGPLSDFSPEYVTLGKMLGGGLVKIGAALIRDDVYDHDFGILHTSTFAEDELSSAIALRVLDILTRDDGRFMRSVADEGHRLMEALRGLRQEFPRVIREVRGDGLMIGLEFEDLSENSPFFRFGARQGFFSLVVASYLLHYHRIRVMAPLTTLLKGNPGKKRMSVLRIQPAASIAQMDVDRLVDGLREVCLAVSRNNECVLVGHLVGLDIDGVERNDPAVVPVMNHPARHRTDFDARIGFVMHPTGVEQVVRYYLPSLEGRVEPRKIAEWWGRLARFLEPDVVHTDYIGSESFVVEANFVLVPYLPWYLSNVYTRARRPTESTRLDQVYLLEIQDKVQDAVTAAKELGDDHIPTSMVGLGAYTSIVTDCGTTINDYEIPITTGNAYTAGLMIQGILLAAKRQGISLPEARAAIVGAAGNIGSVLASILATHVGSLRLIGRGGRTSMQSLCRARSECLLYLCGKVREQVEDGVHIEDVHVGGLGDRILADIVIPELASAEPGSAWRRAASWLREGEMVSTELASLVEGALDARGGQDANDYLTLHESVEAAGDCDIVTIATNSPDSQLISPETVKRGAVVSSASVPSNLSKAFRNHLNDYLVFDGGYARLPEGQELRIIGFPRDGLAHGCFSETLLLGFDGRNHSFARGRLRPDQVEHTFMLAELYGFELGDLIMVDVDHRHLESPAGDAGQGAKA